MKRKARSKKISKKKHKAQKPPRACAEAKDPGLKKLRL